MILKPLPNFILICLIFFSCGEKPELKIENSKNEKKRMNNEVSLVPESNIKKDSVLNTKEPKTTINNKIENHYKSELNSKESKVLLQKIDTVKKLKQETPKEAYKKESFKIPEEWNDVYSDNPEWMQLFQEAQDAFLKGSDKAFTNNSNLRPSKSQIVQRFERQLEPLFHHTPSFIAFSVERFKNSEGLDTLCRKFNLWKD